MLGAAASTFLTLMYLTILAITVVGDDDEGHRRKPSSSSVERVTP